jgi:hypothetical protein
MGWIAEIRRHTFVAIGGFAVGCVFLGLTSTLDHLSNERHSVLAEPPAPGQLGLTLFGVLGFALLIYLMGKLQFPRKRTGVFIFTLFGGSVVTSLAITIARALVEISVP